MKPSQILGFAAAAWGAILVYFQVAGTLAYVNRGATLADAMTIETGLIFGAATLVLVAGLALAAQTALSWAVALIALALNGAVLYLTLPLGTDRAVWLVGAGGEATLFAGFVLRLLRR